MEVVEAGEVGGAEGGSGACLEPEAGGVRSGVDTVRSD